MNRGSHPLAASPSPFPTYKPSDVEWLGDVPAHWEVRRLKFAARIIAGQSPPSEIVFQYSDRFPFLQGNAEFGLVSPTPRLACEEPSKWARAGDILLSVRAPVGALNIADQMYGIGRGLCAITPSPDLTRRFAYYTLRTAKAGLDRASTGSTYDAVTVGDVGGLPLPVPPLPEQRAIVRYLDHVDDRIRRYVSAKEKLIALLEEERQAVIDRAVTRGLDRNMRLKPSGVEWLGEVPEHWEIRPLKRWVSTKITDGPHETPDFLDDGIPFMSAESMVGGRLDFSRRRGLISREQHELYCRKCRPQSNDIFMCKSGATTGKVAIVDTADEFSVWSPLALIRVDPQKVLARLLFAVLQASYVQQQVKDYWSYGTQPNLAMNAMERIAVVLPPIVEQREVLAYLGRATKKISEAIARAHQQIDLLQEYRTRLIADVVTGKLDVREAAASLPEGAGE